jgi:hypothetical protein
MQEPSKRLDPRYPCRLRVALHIGRKVVEGWTEDIGMHGVRLRAAHVPHERELVRLTLLVPPEQHIVLSGMAVRNMPPLEGDDVPGVAIQLYGVDGTALAAWQDVVARVRASHEERPASSPDEPLDGGRAVLELELRSRAELEVLATLDLPRGHMFVVTDLALAAGADLDVDVIHPETRRAFRLRAVVRRARGGIDARGLEIEFPAAREALADAFPRFAGSPPEGGAAAP